MLYIVATTFAFLWLFSLLLNELKKPRNFPPSPLFYPLIGNAMMIEKARQKCGSLLLGIRKIAEKYARNKELIAFKIGTDQIVFTLSPQSVLDMYTNQDLDGRPTGIFYTARTFNLRRGVILTDQEFYTVQSRFLVRQLKVFGFARKGMKEICEGEAEFCLNDFRKMIEDNGGRPVSVKMRSIHSLYVLNSLWQFMASVRYNPDNEELKLLLKILHDLFESSDMMGASFSHFPILKYLAPESSGYNSFVKSHNNIHNFMRIEIEKHKKNFNPSDEPTNLIDAYLKVLYSGDDESEKMHESFSELQLLAICLDMFMAGNETTVKTLNFMFLYLVRDPSIQHKAWMEIDRVIGQNRLPKLDDRVNLPYCEAIVNESLRFFTGNTCGLPHRAMKDTKLCGYDIPMNTTVIPLMPSLMKDPDVFKNPDDFNPQNFLDENGKIKMLERFLPFATGKHRCIGEALARANLFLICTTMLQNFKFEVPSGHDLPSTEPIDGITASIHEYEALIIPRN